MTLDDIRHPLIREVLRLHEVPPRTTVAGVPAKIVGEAGCPEPGLTMDQLLQKVEELGA